MPTRRQVLGGFAALSAGWMSRRAFGGPLLVPSRPPCIETGARWPDLTHPVKAISERQQTFTVGGLRVANEWFGDWFPPSTIPFHSSETGYPGGVPPAPTENVNVAVVGGGLSGLATAYLLRDLRPAVFELHSRFGGTAQGELWRSTPYSLGGAYFIAPDEGTFLESLYHELGLHRIVRVSPSTDDPVEVAGAIDPAFWEGPAADPLARMAFEQYRQLVQRYVDDYPDIPLLPDRDNSWILDLDRMSLKDHIESQLLVPVPEMLRAAIQGYCWSSFNAGWEGVSAASGWNFIAAEEFGRWVLPGGNAGLVSALWSRLRAGEPRPPNCPGSVLRASCRVVEVRVRGQDDVLVVYKDRDGGFRSVKARRVVMCCPKHIARRILTDLETVDPEKHWAIASVHTGAYVVANLLLNKRVRRDWYDLFMLRDGNFPPENQADVAHRPTDVVNGRFDAPGAHWTNVLTLYWPLPFAFSRNAVIGEDSLAQMAARLTDYIDPILSVLGLERSDVHQVRMSRWGHAMPLARPNFIASGIADVVRRPMQGHIYFVHQDNWALPAVETCLLEAQAMADKLRAGW